MVLDKQCLLDLIKLEKRALGLWLNPNHHSNKITLNLQLSLHTSFTIPTVVIPLKKNIYSKNSYIENMLEKCRTIKRELCLTEISILGKDCLRQRGLMKSMCRLVAEL